MTQNEFLILLNLAFIFIAEIGIIYRMGKKKNVLLILILTAGIAVYSGYLALTQVEGSLLRSLLVLLTISLWIGVLNQQLQLALTITKKIKLKYPRNLVAKMVKEMVSAKGYTIAKSEPESIAFNMDDSYIEIDVYSFFRRDYLEVAVAPRKNIMFYVAFLLLIVVFFPVSYSLYTTSLILTQIVYEGIIIDVHIIYVTLFLLLLVWVAMRSIHSRITTTTGIIWSEIYTRLEKLADALRVVEGIQEAKRLQEAKKRAIMRRALEIAKGVALAKSILKERKENENTSSGT